MIDYKNSWYTTKTLLGGKPDTNIRQLYKGDSLMARFNEDMKPWPPYLDRALNEVCAILNDVQKFDLQLEIPPSKTPAAEAPQG